MPSGRPTKFTEEVRSIILEKIEEGNFMQTAAAFAGISTPTFMKWMRYGKLSDPKYAEFKAFRHAVKRARAQAEVRALSYIIKAAHEGTWQSAAWYLERSFKEKYAARHRIVLPPKQTVPPEVNQITKQSAKTELNEWWSETRTSDIASNTGNAPPT